MKNNKEIIRMRMLAGLITEGQYKKLITEVSISNWENIDEYKSILEEYFDDYSLENPKNFDFEVFDDDYVQNSLAFDIAKKAGFKGSIRDLFINEEDFDRYCNMLAKLFLLKHGAAMGSIDKNDSKYQKEIQLLNTELPKLKSKAQSTIDKLQIKTIDKSQIKGNTQTSFSGKKSKLIDYTFNITPDEIDEYGTYDDGVFEVESGDDSMADVYDEIYNSETTGMEWWEDDSVAPFLSEFYDYLLNKAAKEKYGNDTVIKYI